MRVVRVVTSGLFSLPFPAWNQWLLSQGKGCWGPYSEQRHTQDRASGQAVEAGWKNGPPTSQPHLLRTQPQPQVGGSRMRMLTSSPTWKASPPTESCWENSPSVFLASPVWSFCFNELGEVKEGAVLAHLPQTLAVLTEF